ncbi:chemosensory receptor c [Plakobranchus ocellatus]|uniref:Chemosensory receptor c n=1 Tax=Plakobranchus ocellatus TaxID=259542 RepID=A0AAV3ZPD7_9GAST|nr:chemosensory receptor c [Plakobranchus ocellatus]
MSILVPFKAKLMFTPAKSVVAAIFVSILTLITTAPLFVPFGTETFVDTTTNTTFFILVFEESLSSMESFVITWTGCSQVFCLAIIIISNAMLLWGLKKSNRVWVSRHNCPTAGNRYSEANNRARNVASGNIHEISVLHGPTERIPNPPPIQTNPASALRIAREKKIGRMVVILSGIHLASYIPTVVGVCLKGMKPEFRMTSRSLASVLETLNASVNIIVYYQMSTRYRETLDRFWAKCKRRSNRVAPATTADT